MRFATAGFFPFDGPGVELLLFGGLLRKLADVTLFELAIHSLSSRRMWEKTLHPSLLDHTAKNGGDKAATNLLCQYQSKPRVSFGTTSPFHKVHSAMQAICFRGLHLQYSYCILKLLVDKESTSLSCPSYTNALVILLAQYQQHLMPITRGCCQHILRQQVLNLHHINNPKVSFWKWFAEL